MKVVEAPYAAISTPRLWPLTVNAYHALGDLGLMPERTGVKECWLVLGPGKKIEVHRQPASEQFAQCAVHGPGGSLTSAAVPGFTVELGSLFET